VLETIEGMLASRWVLQFLLNHLLKPLEARALPLVVQLVNQDVIFRKEGLCHCGKGAGTSGFVFHLVRAAALDDCEVIKAVVYSESS
jgi:hypothetical protein